MSKFRFSVGPWNVHEGADAFGPEVRKSIALEKKMEKFKEIGFDAVAIPRRRPPFRISTS